MIGKDLQEFGNIKTQDEGGTGGPDFVKLSTGETGSRALHTPIYGPFVRVTLKSLTDADQRKFKVVVYLSK